MSDELKARYEHYARLRSRAIRGPYSPWPDAEGRVIRPHSESGERNEKTHDGSIAFVDCELDDAKMDATAQLMAAAWEMADLIRDQQAEIERLRGGAVPAPGCAVAEAFDRVIQQAGALGPHSQEDALVLARWWRSIFTAPPAPAVPSTRWSKSAARQWMEAVCTKSASPADRFLAVAAHVAGQRYALGESHESTLSHPDGKGAEVAPAPAVPVGFSRDDLEAVAEGLESEPPTVNIGPIEVGDRDTSVESSAAFAARFIRAVLAAPPASAVPDAMPSPLMSDLEYSQGYANGWNACRAAMLAAAPEVPRG